MMKCSAFINTHILTSLTLASGVLLSGCGGSDAPKASGMAAAPKVKLSAAASCTVNCFEKKYIFFGGNFVSQPKDVDPTLAKLKEVIRTGHELGYTGIVLYPVGGAALSNLVSNTLSSNYVDNYKEVIRYAAEQSMELIPVGATPESITNLSPNLIEAIPVTNRPFVVNAGLAKVKPNTIAAGASFEGPTSPYSINDSWNLLDGLARDTSVGHTGNSSIRFDGAKQGMQRLYREIEGLAPNTAYRMTFWVKAQSFESSLAVAVYDGNTQNLLYRNASHGLGLSTNADGKFNNGNVLQSTQDWVAYNLDFNTLGNSKVRIYLGFWNNKKTAGSAWVDDIKVEEVGLNHPIERARTPITVRRLDGTLVPKVDYKVGVESLTMLDASKYPNGTELKVDWFMSSKGLVSTWSAPASSCYQAYFDQSKNIVDKTFTTFGKNSFFVYYDEWRVMNWDKTCTDSTAGDYLARTFAKVRNDIASLSPNAKVYVWNDMFDPYHNAVSKYWMVNGNLSPGMPALDNSVVIVNWNEDATKQADSLKYFSGLGMSQMIALYYDDADLVKTKQWLSALNAAETSATGAARNVNSFMYTTWNNDYSRLAEVKQEIVNAGRWK